MIQMHFTFEGHTIIARRDSVLWHVTIYEHDDGTEKYYQWSDHVMGAVIALACRGDDMGIRCRRWVACLGRRHRLG